MLEAPPQTNTQVTANINTALFESMNPVRMGLIGENDTLETPIIRMVFALAAKTPSIQYVTTQKAGNFTSYDIWVSGLIHDVFGVIDETDQSTWATLLSASRGWEAAYSHPDYSITRRRCSGI